MQAAYLTSCPRSISLTGDGQVSVYCCYMLEFFLLSYTRDSSLNDVAQLHGEPGLFKAYTPKMRWEQTISKYFPLLTIIQYSLFLWYHFYFLCLPFTFSNIYSSSSFYFYKKKIKKMKGPAWEMWNVFKCFFPNNINFPSPFPRNRGGVDAKIHCSPFC